MNAKKLFFLHSIFAPTRVNMAPFMIAHMNVVRTARKGPISFGDLITSIARVMGLHTELATLGPLPSNSLGLHACRYMRLIKAMSDGRYLLMVHNISIDGVILPCSNRTKV